VSMCHTLSGPVVQPHFRLRRMQSEPGTPPAIRADEAVPRRRRRRYSAEPLREKSQGAGRDVPVVGGGHHVADRLDLGARQSMRRGART
jgi:hypothetical protein